MHTYNDNNYNDAQVVDTYEQAAALGLNSGLDQVVVIIDSVSHMSPNSLGQEGGGSVVEFKFSFMPKLHELFVVMSVLVAALSPMTLFIHLHVSATSKIQYYSVKCKILILRLA